MAYWQGMQDGARMVREQIAADDEALWRQAVRNVADLAERVDRRRAADAPGARPGDFTGRAA